MEFKVEFNLNEMSERMIAYLNEMAGVSQEGSGPKKEMGSCGEPPVDEEFTLNEMSQRAVVHLKEVAGASVERGA